MACVYRIQKLPRIGFDRLEKEKKEKEKKKNKKIRKTTLFSRRHKSCFTMEMKNKSLRSLK